MLRNTVRSAVEEAMKSYMQGPMFNMYAIPTTKKDELINAIADNLCNSGISADQNIVPLRDVITKALLSEAARKMTNKQDLAEYIANKIEEAS